MTEGLNGDMNGDMNGKTDGEVHPSRRAVVLGAGAVGAAGFLAACGGGSTPSGGTDNPATSGPRPSPTSDVLAKKSQVPVGSGKIDFADAIVVTQPTAGQFLGFSAICTHQGCVVAKVQGDTIICACHGSEYSVKDGSVKKGPARQPLDKVAIKVEGDDIKLAS
jgi:Rieske Fe-S protein